MRGAPLPSLAPLTSRSVSLAKRYEKDPLLLPQPQRREEGSNSASGMGWDGMGRDVSLMINNKDNISDGRTTTFYCRRAFHSSQRQQPPTILQTQTVGAVEFPPHFFPSCSVILIKVPPLHGHSRSLSASVWIGIRGVTRVA